MICLVDLDQGGGFCFLLASLGSLNSGCCSLGCFGSEFCLFGF
jgi:hypothetical protein